MRRFVVIGQKATASPDFSLVDIAGTSGRLDVLLRCTRAALLISHGVRLDAVVYLVLLGGVRAPRSIRIDGAAARYLRPDERSLATTVRKALATTGAAGSFTAVRPGVAIAEGGLGAVITDVGGGARYVLDEHATDLRTTTLDTRDPVFFVGDHLGLDDATARVIRGEGATPIGIGPVSVHADDAIAIVSNELDRRNHAG